MISHKGVRKTLVLHCGMGKTGTTALQHFLWQNRGLLLERGVLYPEQAAVAGAHHLIIPEVPPAVAHISWKYQEPDEWLPPVLATAAPVVLMSTELLAWASVDAIAAFCERLRRQVDLKVCFYLRRQDNMIMAGYNQQTKAGTQKARLQDVIERQIERFDYLAKLWPWEKSVGARNMIVRAYERTQFVGGDLMTDFLWTTLGLTPDGMIPLKDSNANPRFTRAALEFKRLINNVITDPLESARYNEPLLAWSAAKDACESQSVFQEHDTLTHDERLHILRRFRASNGYIARKFLGRGDGVLFEELVGTQDLPSEPARVPSIRDYIEIAQWIDNEAPDLAAALADRIREMQGTPAAPAVREAIDTLGAALKVLCERRETKLPA